MTNETKESLREEFYKKFDADGSGEFCSSEDGDSHSSKSIADFWLEKLDQALKSQMEEIKENIISIPIKNESGSDYEMAQLRYREKVLSLIQNN